MNKDIAEDELSDEEWEAQERYAHPMTGGVVGGLSEEERQRMEDLISRGELEPGPSTLERYVHPLTGEVLIEGGPDTPEVRALREEEKRWYLEEFRPRQQRAQERWEQEQKRES